MTDATKDLLKRALELSPAEREHLAREILASIEPSDVDADADPEFVAELRRRVESALRRPSGSSPRNSRRTSFTTSGESTPRVRRPR